MTQSKYPQFVFNLELPCVGAVIYDSILENFAYYLPDFTHHQGHHKITAL